MCKTIKHKVRFKIPPETIYDLLADLPARVVPVGRLDLATIKMLAVYVHSLGGGQ